MKLISREHLQGLAQPPGVGGHREDLDLQGGGEFIGGHIVEKEIFTVAKDDIGNKENRALQLPLQGGNDIGTGQQVR